MQLGARGVSVLVASGDFGPGSACLSNDGKDTLKYLPAFPASCPFVTTVGGTYFFNPETAVPFSGGGFSETFPRPAYQQDAVLGWLNRVDYKDAVCCSTRLRSQTLRLTDYYVTDLLQCHG